MCYLPYHFSSESKISLPVFLTIVLMAVVALPLYANTDVAWHRAVYWDVRYPSAWAGGGEAIRDALEYVGYEVLDADQLKAWMDAHITSGMSSVVVFCHDIAPDTVIESMSSRCTLRRYLDAGGKIVWYADIPMYYQGHVDGTRTDYGVNGSINILGFNAASGPWDSQDEVAFTVNGVNWGLTEKWQSERPTSGDGLRVLAEDDSGYAAAWVKHYVLGDNYRGFVRLFDRGGEPNINDIQRVAEYPNVIEPFVLDNQAESEDDIIGTFFYPWYGNPTTSGLWNHWEGGSNPPKTWSANYLPNYPDSTWNPSVQLYDSTDTEVLRWQDRAMARAGIDIAIASWWGIGSYEDAAFAKAIRTCKSVQWCIYYEPEGYVNPSPQKIYGDIKYVIDNYGPTRNYAKVDSKWLVLVYVAGGEEAADRWRNAKAMLASGGYDVYLNGDGASAPDAWDSVHSYSSIVRQGLTNTLPNVDDSAWISPGFWGVWESPLLERSLIEFKSACNDIVANRESYRFILVETWNEWHEGTQIEPGQEIIPDPQGYKPKPEGDYGYTFIDAIAPAAVSDLHWISPGHRAVVPSRLQAEDMIWDDDSKIELSQDPNKILILEKDVRIGSSILLPETPDSNEAIFTIRANAVTGTARKAPPYPRMTLYLDDAGVAEWEVLGKVPQLGVEHDDQDYTAAVPVDKGIHKIELAMTYDVGNWDLIVDFIDVNAMFPKGPNHEGRNIETFETSDFNKLDWVTRGDEEWFITSDQSNTGQHSARAGSIDDDEVSILEVTLDCITGDIHFHYKVSSESGFDYLRFYIDGEEEEEWSGEQGWLEVSLPVTAGRRTFRWEYSKDSSASNGADTAWIDDIVFPRQ